MMLARTLLSSALVPESNAFVLLCAEEDDLALVPWVHAARQRELAPEVVTGVDVDDAPLVHAIGDGSCRLFVVLRSASLGAVRMRAIEAAFAEHRHANQRLFALRIDAAAHLAIDRVVAELAGASRPRSDLSMVMTIDALFDEPVDTGPADGADRPMVEVPTVDEALRLADRAAEREVTGQFEVGDETIPLAVVAEGAGVGDGRGWRRARAWVAGIGLAIGSVGMAVVGSGAGVSEPAVPTSVAVGDEPSAGARPAMPDDVDAAEVTERVRGDAPAEASASARAVPRPSVRRRAPNRRSAAPAHPEAASETTVRVAAVDGPTAAGASESTLPAPPDLDARAPEVRVPARTDDAPGEAAVGAPSMIERSVVEPTPEHADFELAVPKANEPAVVEPAPLETGRLESAVIER